MSPGRSYAAGCALLAKKPAQRTHEDVERLVAFLSSEPYFEGASCSSLQALSPCITLQRCRPGEVLLHAEELTDRLYLVLGGRLSVVRHSRREGFSPGPPALVTQGQTLCEGALVVSGRRSDLAVTVPAPEPGAPEDPAAEGGGASLAVVTRAAWNNLCARAPTQPEAAEGRLALLSCMARALARTEPAGRSPEQAEDLAAVLKQLPGMSAVSPPVLKSISEAAALRHLPPGTILYEEFTRAESQFLVLSGNVQEHMRPKRQGQQNRAALRSALKSAHALSRSRSAVRRSAVPVEKTVKQKIEDERRAREEIQKSLALQREGIRSPPRERNPKPVRAKAVEEEFKRWMLEFLTRKRGGALPTTSVGPDPGSNAAAKAAAAKANPAAAAAAAKVAAAPAPAAKAANAWKRAAFVATHTPPAPPEPPPDPSTLDATMLEYEQKKREEAGVTDVGHLLGAAARSNYMRGLADGRRAYPSDTGSATSDGHPGDGHHLRWGGATESAASSAGAHGHGRLGSETGMHADPHDPHAHLGVIEDDDEEADPWVRLTYLDRRHRLVRKPIKYIDAVERVMGVAKDSAAREAAAAAGSTGASPGRSDKAPDAPQPGQPDAPPGDMALVLADGEGVGEEGDLLDGGLDTAAGITREESAGKSSKVAGAGTAGGAGGDGPPPDEEVEDADDEHLEQLYGPCQALVEAGAVAGEVPPAALDRRATVRPRRTASAIAGPNGADVLIVMASALRRGHDAARDDLVSGRLAVLEALEPLRALSEEHRAALALGAAVVSYDTNQIVVRQGQSVELLYVVLEGEVRLLDDPEAACLPATASGGSDASPGVLAAGPKAPASASSFTAATAPILPGSGADGSPQPTARGPGGGLGSMGSIRARRAMASLPALMLLGPGGSFGESVLGFPEDVAKTSSAQERAAAEGAELTFPASAFLASAVAARPTKLLALQRSLLAKHASLRSALPAFAALRREAVVARRSQLQSSMASRPAGGLAVSAPNSPAFRNGDGVSTGVMTTPASATHTQFPSLSSPTAGGDGAAGARHAPRPPAAARPMELLEQLGFKPVMRRGSSVYAGVPTTVQGKNVSPTKTGGHRNGLTGSGGLGSPTGGSFTSGSFTGPPGGFATGASVLSSMVVNTGSSGGSFSYASTNAAAAVASSGGSFTVLDRQRRDSLLASSMTSAVPPSLPLVRPSSGSGNLSLSPHESANGPGSSLLSAGPLQSLTTPSSILPSAGGFKPRAMRTSLTGLPGSSGGAPMGMYGGASAADGAAAAAAALSMNSPIARRSSISDMRQLGGPVPAGPGPGPGLGLALPRISAAGAMFSPVGGSGPGAGPVGSSSDRPSSVSNLGLPPRMNLRSSWAGDGIASSGNPAAGSSPLRGPHMSVAAHLRA
ncbi:hypothetical protein HYH03_009748 [Edaphochlamys debaryana]|uniref:Cyclic nucleotide-binding domain-containing protein n=1 Tax=Edaphochlamys debaryana TaxID=47281 RepID=A0A835Y6Q6_9CHLO|nr:hypothetical protein HYH03_009748 [Edaphochlamys debaryana]|eukprot:KAG2492019.1 hypothetical protein HYH03_009748 [Edaphochlamys debaryana]